MHKMVRMPPESTLFSFYKPYVPLCPFIFCVWGIHGHVCWAHMFMRVLRFNINIACVAWSFSTLSIESGSLTGAQASLPSQLAQEITCLYLPLSNITGEPPYPPNINTDHGDLNCHFVPILTSLDVESRRKKKGKWLTLGGQLLKRKCLGWLWLSWRKSSHLHRYPLLSCAILLASLKKKNSFI